MISRIDVIRLRIDDLQGMMCLLTLDPDQEVMFGQRLSYGHIRYYYVYSARAVTSCVCYKLCFPDPSI